MLIHKTHKRSGIGRFEFYAMFLFTLTILYFIWLIFQSDWFLMWLSRHDNLPLEVSLWFR